MLPLELLLRRRWDARALVRDHPPVRLTARKHAVLLRACPPERPARGTVEVTRWGAGAVPECIEPGDAAIEIVPGWFAYDPPQDAAVPEWHLNFASSVAFGTYPLALFAQDEMQVLEHPALMSVHEALRAEGHLPRTVETDGRPTPVLVRGVERRCAIDVAPNAQAGRLALYGNAFEAAPPAAILAATRVFDPPPSSDILAIEAPAYGAGRYEAAEIAFILRTAWAGFAAAREASRADGGNGPAPRPVVHSGYWGCGAYGGNRVLMTLLQCVAARAAGVGRLVLHAGNDPADAHEGAATAATLLKALGREPPVATLVRRVESLGLRWGIGDGN